MNNKDFIGLVLCAAVAVSVTAFVAYQYGFHDGVKSDMPVLVQAYDDTNNNGCPDQIELSIADRDQAICENTTALAVGIARFVTANKYYNAFDNLIGCCDRATFNMTCARSWNETYYDLVYQPKIIDFVDVGVSSRGVETA